MKLHGLCLYLISLKIATASLVGLSFVLLLYSLCGWLNYTSSIIATEYILVVNIHIVGDLLWSLWHHLVTALFKVHS